MDVAESLENLAGQELDQVLVKTSVPSDQMSNRSTGNIFQENTVDIVFLLKAQVLHYVHMIQVFQRVNLCTERVHDLLGFPLRREPFGDHCLFHSNHFSGGDVQCKVHLAKRSNTDEFTLDPRKLFISKLSYRTSAGGRISKSESDEEELMLVATLTLWVSELVVLDGALANRPSSESTLSPSLSSSSGAFSNVIAFSLNGSNPPRWVRDRLIVLALVTVPPLSLSGDSGSGGGGLRLDFVLPVMDIGEESGIGGAGAER
ncbi:hypothetical protein OGAPHI_001090 [Ogataea philodendri]|uniref:Uncharacterized protein n=1 Tax=Ogataea philodendri TaxID=1378263 RepID=A0A9P8PFA5_9ASCO|nr:uncharacterized protein OGAPHI_001090 [Ogataea philodendri]KAH3670575.1 hypothetical protein OGAPHI_001090 [Ogataea philodendri]